MSINEADQSKSNVVKLEFNKKKKSNKVDYLSQSKLELFAEIIEQGIVQITLDPRVKGVIVPDDFKKDFALHLNFSLNYGLSDFEYDDDGIKASLSFSGELFFCHIPWKAVYAIVSQKSGKGCVWPESLPKDLPQQEIIKDTPIKKTSKKIAKDCQIKSKKASDKSILRLVVDSEE